jgi:thiol-disulfide isomerase/thioredoxin
MGSEMTQAIKASPRATLWYRVLNQWLTRVLLFAALILIVLRVAPLFRGQPIKRIELQRLNLVQLDGTPVQSSMLKGKSALVNFWAPWCPPCRLEIPWLQRVQDREAGNLVVLGVVADPSEDENALRFMQRRGVTYLLVRDSPALDAAFGGVSVLPTSFYIAASGTVIHRTQGIVPEPLMLFYAHQAMHHE